MRVALGCTNEENLESIRQTVEAAKAAGKEVLIDCEHFFDGFKANPAYALACAEEAYKAGARWVVLCDTNGGTGATTRVLIESRDGKGNRWFTVGVSPNLVDASFQALSDALVYKLVREGVTAD